MKDVHKQYFFEILKKYRLGTASEEEIKFLEAYYDVFENNDDFLAEEQEQEAIKARVKLNVDQEISLHERSLKRADFKRKLVKYYSVAALLLVTLSAGSYFIFKSPHVSDGKLIAEHEISPGKNRAILTLANGKKILLDDVRNGVIAKMRGLNITKTADGQIVYTVVPEEGMENEANSPVLNTVSTPKSGQYQVMLPDGTRVWLNSVSSLRYPTSFTGGQRLVELLSGEAYFEVAKNKEMPFRVKTALQTVEVLGTHFNINAYDDESAIKTTLLEGSVKVTCPDGKALLSPGQQSSVDRKDGSETINDNVNLAKVVAWKNGVFSFENDDLKSIMRQISRWYDVSIIYNGPVSDEKFFGEISRSSNLSQVFKILELNNVHFDVSGKIVRVSSGQASTRNK